MAMLGLQVRRERNATFKDARRAVRQVVARVNGGSTVSFPYQRSIRVGAEVRDVAIVTAKAKHFEGIIRDLGKKRVVQGIDLINVPTQAEVDDAKPGERNWLREMQRLHELSQNLLLIKIAG